MKKPEIKITAKTANVMLLCPRQRDLPHPLCLAESRRELNEAPGESKSTGEDLSEALKCLGGETRVHVHGLALTGPTPNDLHVLLTLLSQSQPSSR